jgi:hypothetical protein
VNWQHLQAFVWLRWRLLKNQWRRAGALNAIVMMIMTFFVVATVIPLAIGCFFLGLYAIPKAEPVHLMLVWDGLVVAFLFFWSIGVVAELQRTDPLSLSKFLHLPVSVNSAFMINYLSSLFRLSLFVFVPVALAYCLALVICKGMWLSLAFPLLAAFLLMVTALTYQLQGWLASLMSNPRRRRTVVVCITAVFILIAQLPNLLNFLAPWRPGQRARGDSTFADEIAKINRDAQSQKLDSAELERRLQEVGKNHERAGPQAERESFERLKQTARLLNVVLPFGWLPLGVLTAAERHALPAILGLLGMTAIGTASLWRAYGTTLGMYRAQPTARKTGASPAVTQPAKATKPVDLMVETRLPGVSEPVAAVALGGLRSLARAPEAKMMLLTPLIAAVAFGAVLVRNGNGIPLAIRPLIGIGAMMVVLFGLMQLMSNQFGFDRDGFRVFVLCAAQRRDILLGKNLAFAPLALGMAAILLVLVQIVCPLRWDHFLAMIPQYVMMFLLFCLLMNLLSIYTPIYIAAGSVKPSSPKATTALVQMAMFTFIFPLTQGMTLLPLGIEMLLGQFGWAHGIPACLLLTLLECAAVVVLYLLFVGLEGSLLQDREKQILETVTKGAS